MGADDYVAKPFNSRELTARIRAVLRRASQSDASVAPALARFLCFDGWRLDTGKRELIGGDEVVVALSNGEYELLLAFALRPQRILSRDQLLDLTRGRSAVIFDRSIDIQVSRLRRKLNDDPRDPVLIKTVWGGGYLFSADVTEA
jgi:two-component system OmpR family response regulator